jgi:hypothetical protein
MAQEGDVPLFRPEFEGELALPSIPDDFTARIQHRLEAGLLMAGYRGPRTNYRVEAMDRHSITFASSGFLTHYNVGLNRVSVTRPGPGRLAYKVSYWKWTLLGVAHGAILTLVFVALYALMPGMRRDIDAYRYGPALFWSMVASWCLVWPWLLSAIHRKYVERALQRILRETLSTPGAADRPAA